jgi:putative ABC transport system permease protein
MCGANLARELGLSVGSTCTVAFQNPAARIESERQFSVRGIVSTGGLEDDQLFVNLASAGEMSGRPGLAHAVFVSALCNACPAEEMAEEIEMSLSVKAKSVRQLAASERAVISRLDGLMSAASGASLLGASFVVATAMTSGVVERRREIGVMRAVGASGARIAAVFLAEAVLCGLAGGLGGLAAGLALAQVISVGAFGAPVVVSSRVVPLAIGVALGVAAAGSVFPIHRALKLRPAAVLRGD